MDPLAAAVDPGLVGSDRSFRYGDPEEAFARRRPRRLRPVHVPALELYTGRVLRRDRRLGQARGSLTAWANFQGPFTLHSVAAASLGLPGSKLRLITPPDSGGSYGIKSTVYVYVVLMALASQEARRPRPLDRRSARAPRREPDATARVTDVEAAFSRDGELLALRYDAVEDVGAYVRAPEPATLYRMHGSLSGAYRVANVAVRNRVVLTNRCPTGLNRGFGGPQLYFALERTMAIAARRLGLDPADVARRNLIGPRRIPVPHAERRPLRLRRLRRRCLDDAAPPRAATRSGEPRPGSGRAEGQARRRRARGRRRAVDLEHGLHHARADGRGACTGAAEVG